MIKATFTLRGITPYSASLYVYIEVKANETHDAADKRVWRDKAHFVQAGKKPADTDEVYIPAVQLRRALFATAKYLSIKIPGGGQATYTKHFEQGIVVRNALNADARPIGIGVTRGDIDPVDVMCSSTGNKSGKGGCIVPRRFPIAPLWAQPFEVSIHDDKITEEIFTRVLKEAGMFNGLGRWRPQNGGDNGRFVVEELTFTQQ